MAEAEDSKKDTESEKKIDNGQNPAEAPPPAKSKLSLFIIIGIVLILLIGGIVCFLFLTESGKHLIGHDKKEVKVEKAALPESLSFYSIPEMMVNLIPTGKKTPFLRLGLKLELPNAEAQKTIELLLPRIIDQFQMYLRELRIEDIEGSAGIHRLREELLKRANAVTNPLKIKDVLFEVFLVQ